MIQRLLTLCLILLALPAFAANRITVTLTVTNTPSDGNTFVLNSDTRTWKTTVATASTQVAIAAGTAETATNLLRHVSANPFSGPVIPSRYETNVLKFVGTVGQAMAASLTGTWGELSYSTQTVASVSAVRVPLASTVEYERTNHATLLVEGIEDYSLAPFDELSTAMAEVVGLTSTQTISGPKTFSGSTYFAAPQLTNGVNYGNAFRSPGSGTRSEQFGTSATAAGDDSVAIGYQANAADDYAVSIGRSSEALYSSSIALGTSASAGAHSGIAIGDSASVTAENGVAIGDESSVTHIYSVALMSSTTASNQIRLGGATHNVSVPGTITGTITNSTIYGTVGLLSSGYWSSGGATNLTSTNGIYYGVKMPPSSVTSLANGNNADLDFDDYTVVTLRAGPTGAFAICGIADGVTGRLLHIINRTGQNMTIANDSGVEATASRRIYTLTGSDIATTGDGAATLVYDGTDSRWIVLSYQQ